MVIQLPMFEHKGAVYTVDRRLREFRRLKFVKGSPQLDFIPFRSKDGKDIMKIYRNTILERGY